NENPIMLMFSKMGAIAETANRWKLFRIPIANADKLTNATYGNTMRFKTAVVSSFPGVTEKPYANNGTIHGENRMQRTTTAVIHTIAALSSAFTNSQALRRSPSTRYFEKTGMNAALTAPSPTSRRRRFGIRYAIVNESASEPAPRRKAIRESRT